MIKLKLKLQLSAYDVAWDIVKPMSAMCIFEYLYFFIMTTNHVFCIKTHYVTVKNTPRASSIVK